MTQEPPGMKFQRNGKFFILYKFNKVDSFGVWLEDKGVYIMIVNGRNVIIPVQILFWVWSVLQILTFLSCAYREDSSWVNCVLLQNKVIGFLHGLPQRWRKSESQRLSFHVYYFFQCQIVTFWISILEPKYSFPFPLWKEIRLFSLYGILSSIISIA